MNYIKCVEIMFESEPIDQKFSQHGYRTTLIKTDLNSTDSDNITEYSIKFFDQYSIQLVCESNYAGGFCDAHLLVLGEDYEYQVRMTKFYDSSLGDYDFVRLEAHMLEVFRLLKSVKNR